jgi:hypothetical protein
MVKKKTYTKEEEMEVMQGFNGYPVATRNGHRRCYKPEELLSMTELIDIVGNCKILDSKDMIIMDKWEEWFRSKDVPYAIVQKGNELVLWKERLA